ncbi:uncharacterized protein LOC115737430 isoform X2 [Rhodamnia argentea]|uniref:Uncharacterized protein LOC115737430 isoform X2 n=1 Tax=Rhodamnia argentea TaxID=178133 RepID=A0ABM3GYW2_9MYRT|nr:uncharacterized protein LOC115737430 isoform X2 [Rhodamnia argentea]
MASHLCLQLPKPLSNSKSLHSNKKPKIKATALNPSKLIRKDRENYGCSNNFSSSKFFLAYHPSPREFSLEALSSVASLSTDETIVENWGQIVKSQSKKMEFNRVNCLVWVLHESAKSFSAAIESLELEGSSAEISMAWLGQDVHQWHKRISYQVAVYGMLTTAVEVEILLSHERSNNPSVVREILSPRLDLIKECIESQLSEQHTELVVWFREVELPRVAGFFIPLLKKWSVEYAGSGVAGIVIAISCCSAVAKLGPRQSSCRMLSMSIDAILLELMELSRGLVSVEKGHQLATEAGFELDFLTHFGRKFLPSEESEELEFWIGLAQKKLSLAFQKEPLVSCMEDSRDKVKAENLAILGLFAYLGRRTRLYLTKMGIREVDEQVKDFLSYLECGIIFIYPGFSSVQMYQIFMELIIDEIGWLDFYASHASSPDRKRSKQHVIQAETEIILSRVFTTCYDVFSGFAHFSRSTLQPLDSELLAFLLRSQSLLSACLEDYWVVYDRSSKTSKAAETGASDPTLTSAAKRKALSTVLEAQHEASVSMTQEHFESESQHVPRSTKDSSSNMTVAIATVDRVGDAKTNARDEGFCRKFGIKLVSASNNIGMGTQLLWIDITLSLELLLKQMRGHNITTRERKKVSAVGHAAMLAAIKKYIPSLIPSPYSKERLDIVKQLNRTKKMEVRLWSNLEDSSLKIT